MIHFKPIPVLFHVGSFNVYTFGFVLALAVLVALFFISREVKKLGIKEEKAYNLVFFIIVGSVIGSRLAYFLINIKDFTSVFEIFAIWHGGFLGIGAVIGGLTAALLYIKKSKLDFGKVMDMVVPYVALAFAIGRIGCFLRGCCFGLPTSLPWGIAYSQESLAGAINLAGIPLHPTQLYLVLSNFMIFLVLRRISKIRYRRDKKSRFGKFFSPGKIFLLFLALFSAQRFLVDFVRYHPAQYFISFLTMFQIVYASIFIFACILLFKTKALNSYSNLES